MAAALFSTQETANQVGGSFVTQYYNMLHQHPDQVYQFYKNESNMFRIDGNTTVTSNGILEIHSVISNLKFTSIEIKTANFQNSLHGGIMVMVTGLIQAGQYEKRRKFIQSFFLATQETGYFILNDFFHYVDEEYFCTPALLAQGNYESVSVPVCETGYSLDLQNYPNEIAIPSNGDYSYPTQEISPCQPVTPFEETLNSSFSNLNLTLNSSFSNVNLSDPTDPFVNQAPIRHTYASILKSRVTVTETESPVIPVRSHTSLSDKSSLENNTACEYEVESKSVYVKNVGWHLTETDLYNAFKQFGRLAPDSVAIRSNKLMQETGRYYAFVEYEDMEGVQNALMASPVDINGWNVYVEQRKRSNKSSSTRGRGRGKGGRFGGRGKGNGSRVNGFE
ncbi:hypothetical protein LUZ60_012232 [Juncus effusus]|nr:hypothetical protein LUZ60_012232 [Juncus effusus]